MTDELYWLTLVVLMTSVMWLPYILNRIAVRGVWRTLSDKRAESGQEQPEWAQRAMRAHANAVENLVLFAPVILILHFLQISTPTTHLAAAVYFFARLAHFLAYTFAVPGMRTVSFAVGWAACLVLVLTVLGWI